MPTVVYFLFALALLIGGYVVYSRVAEKLFGPDHNRATPAETMADGVDYIKLPTWKIFMIQLLNIAGVGPVFGPILGALYGPSALLWIVFGAILAGGIHDYFSGMLSVRYHGKSLPDVIGFTLGNVFKQIMRVFSVVLLVLVGVVFVSAPAGLLAKLTPEWMNFNFWMIVIFMYYFLATVLPIDVIIARLYPLFGAVLIVMAVGVSGGLILGGYAFYSWPLDQVTNVFSNQHPNKLPMWPLMFVTIACGALSGFHATQSPLMSRCVPNERCGRAVFYGSMIAEGIIALIWATAGMTFYDSAQSLLAALGPKTNAALVVDQVCRTLLGPVGGVLAILGVVALPVTSGDTAFRAARLVIADVTSMSQSKPLSRLLIAVPLFLVGAAISQVDFGIIWRYFGWANQSLATIVLWAAAAYVVKRGGLHWLVSLPATFMTAVVITYLCNQKIGFGLDYTLSVYFGAGAAAVALLAFLASMGWFRRNTLIQLPQPGQAN
ncbi:MAG: carbon starvation protein A [Desulfovibrio sp.]|jgi:carbon starvation protein CstA|nr:carbon starvation protein A [Desulfovibrio sp.]